MQTVILNVCVMNLLCQYFFRLNFKILLVVMSLVLKKKDEQILFSFILGNIFGLLFDF